MRQRDLFDYDPEYVPARRTDPETSHAAARSIATTDLEDAVLDLLRKRGPMTTEEIAAHSGLSLVTVSPRMAPLRTKRMVEQIGKRKNLSGRLAIVWAPTGRAS